MTATALMAMAATFNLICSGNSVTTSAVPNSKAEISKFRTIYRVDLDQRRYCQDECERTRSFSIVTNNELVFQYLDGPEGFFLDVTVSREDGGYSVTIQSPSSSGFKVGTCTKAPFTGFPTRKF